MITRDDVRLAVMITFLLVGVYAAVMFVAAMTMPTCGAGVPIWSGPNWWICVAGHRP